MDLTIDPDVEALRALVASLGRERLRPLGLEADRAGAPLPPTHPFFREAVEMGLGAGFAGRLDDVVETSDAAAERRPRRAARRGVVMAEEAAYWDRGMATSLPGPGLGMAPVLLLGTDEQKKRWLSMFKDRSEPRWAAFAMSEPGAGSDVAAIRTRARPAEGGWVLDGEKTFISNGARASWVATWATVDPTAGRAGHRCFVVERGTPGFTVVRVDKKMGLAASETATLAFDGCRVPADHLLGGEEAYRERGGFRGAMRSFDMTRPMVAAMAIGIGRAALDETRRFVAEHGAGLGARRLERARERLARMRAKLDAGRLCAWRAAWLADHREDSTLVASLAKAFSARAAFEAASLGLEVLRGAGAAGDALVEKLFRDVKALDIVEGTGEIQRIVIARRMIGYGERAAGASGEIGEGMSHG
jgi:acyl-CoA dehydrogenase